ncbi:MAG: hypothetical protein AAGF07_00305 [Patescibacteria group bacterium]
MQRDKLELLLEKTQTVFDIKELAAAWDYLDYKKVKELARYYSGKQKLLRVAHGLYSTTDKPKILEVAQKLQTPSYITYHTALSIHGINFQFYSNIHCFSKRKKEVVVLGQKIIYHQTKLETLFNPLGIEKKEGYYLASLERSICDSLYLSPGLAFDNLKNINSEKILEISQIYGNKRVEREILKIVKYLD